jgi:hypothetical protein
MFMAIRRASSRVNRLAAVRRPGFRLTVDVAQRLPVGAAHDKARAVIFNVPWGSKAEGLVGHTGHLCAGYWGDQIGEAGSALPSQVHSRAASKITNAPGMTIANTNSKNRKREVMSKKLFRHCRLFGGQGTRGPSIGET